MAAEALTATEYIKHHMAHLASAHQGSVVDFSIVNYDTIFFSVLMLAVMFFLLRAGAKKATSGVPGKMQCAVEMLVEPGQEHRARRPHLRGSAGFNRVLLGRVDELHRLDSG